MKVLHLNTHDLGVGHYRMWGPARALQRAGVDVTYFEAPDGKGEAFTILNMLHKDGIKWLAENISDYDLMHVGYSTLQAHLEVYAALRNQFGVPFIVDLDDDFYNIPSYNLAYKHYHSAAPERRFVRLMLKIADGVSVSTRSLKDVVEASGDAKHVYLTPNCHEALRWAETVVDPQRADDKDVRVMFAGGQGRYGDLDVIREPLEKLMAARSNVKLIFLGCAPDWALPWMPSKTDPSANRAFVVRFCDLRTYFQALKWVSPDILVNPVIENEFNKSKSHIKALEAGGCGAALVCTDWPTHEMVPNDVCMKVSNTTTQWLETLEALIDDDAIRHKKQRQLADWVATQAYDAYISHWTAMYDDVLRRGARDLDAEYLASKREVTNADCSV